MARIKKGVKVKIENTKYFEDPQKARSYAISVLQTGVTFLEIDEWYEEDGKKEETGFSYSIYCADCGKLNEGFAEKGDTFVCKYCDSIKKEIAPIDSEEGIKQRDQARDKILKKAKEERLKKSVQKIKPIILEPKKSKKKSTKYPKKFTPAVDRYIKDHAADMSNEDLAVALKRVFKIDTTPGSVGNRKSVIGAETKKPGPKSKIKESDEKDEKPDALDDDIDELDLDN